MRFGTELVRIAEPVIRRRSAKEEQERRAEARQEATYAKKRLIEARRFFAENKPELREQAKSGERGMDLSLSTVDSRLPSVICRVLRENGFRASHRVTYIPGTFGGAWQNPSHYAITVSW